MNDSQKRQVWLSGYIAGTIVMCAVNLVMSATGVSVWLESKGAAHGQAIADWMHKLATAAVQ